MPESTLGFAVNRWQGDLLLVDASNLLFRLVGNSKSPKHLALMFIEKIVTMRRFYRCFVEVCWEGSNNWRFKHHPEYKGNRDRTTDDFLRVKETISILRKIVPHTNIVSWDGAECEGDDVMGAVALRAALGGESVAILSTDRDLQQLLEEDVSLVLLQPGKEETRVVDVEAAIKYVGLHPCLLPDLKGLQGDRGDNIPGIPGFGPVRATELIELYGSVENLFEAIEKPEAERSEDEKQNDYKRRLRSEYSLTMGQLDKLKKNKDLALMSKKVGEIDTDVKVWVDKVEVGDSRHVSKRLNEVLGHGAGAPYLSFCLSREGNHENQKTG